MRRHQDAHEGRPHRRLDALVLVSAHRGVERIQLAELLIGQRPAVRLLGERLQVLEILPFRSFQRFRLQAQPLANVLEEYADGVFGQFGAGGLDVRALEINLLEPRQRLVLDQLGVFLLEGVEIGVLEEVPLRPLKKDEAAEEFLPDAGDEVQLVPEAIELLASPDR